MTSARFKVFALDKRIAGRLFLGEPDSAIVSGPRLCGEVKD